ncbi:MAG: shikimate kinase, partial [Minicystis sp.]
MTRPRLPLLLQGFMGAGKSTTGRLVAARAGVPFVDLDAQIEARAGTSVAALFATQGEAAFRALEAEELQRLLDDRRPQVVALGGGALLDQARRRAALGRAFVLTLAASPATLVARTAGETRPLLAGPEGRLTRIEALLAQRAEAYAEAHAHVTTDDRSPEAVAEAVLAAWDRPTLAVLLGVRSYAVRFVQADPRAVAAA